MADDDTRLALRKEVAGERSLSIAALSSRLRPVLTFHQRTPLDALLLDSRLLDASFDLAAVRAISAQTRLFVIGNTTKPDDSPRERQRQRSLISSPEFDGVIDGARSPAQQAAEIVSRLSDPAVPARVPGRAERTTTTARASTQSFGLSKAPTVIVLACSTGGPQALNTVIPALRADFPVPIVIVQHMPPNFTGQLAERLDKQSALQVREVTEPVTAKVGEVWVAPGGRHVVFSNRLRRIELNDGPPENSCRPSADVLFRSAAKFYGSTALGVVLTGMGDDGTRGAQAMSDKGASIIVQDEASSVVWGMPGSIAKAGLANLSLPIESVASTLTRICRTRPSPVHTTVHRHIAMTPPVPDR